MTWNKDRKLTIYGNKRREHKTHTTEVWQKSCTHGLCCSCTASSFNTWFFVTLVPRLQNKTLRSILRNHPRCIKNKLSTCSLHCDPSDICTKTWTLFKPNASKQTIFHCMCPDDRLISVSSVDKIEQWLPFLLAFEHSVWSRVVVDRYIGRYLAFLSADKFCCLTDALLYYRHRSVSIN